MWIYLVKRVLYFLPTLFVIAVLAFLLSKAAPGDPVLLYLEGVGQVDTEDRAYRARIFRETRQILKLDKPGFYFALRPAAYPDTLYRLLSLEERQWARQMIAQTGNWPAVSHYRSILLRSYQTTREAPDSLGPEALTTARKRLKDLQLVSDTSLIRKRLDLQDETLRANPQLASYFEATQEELRRSYAQMISQRNQMALYRPRLDWYGLDNQFHHWFKGLFTGDLGYSYRDGRPVRQKVASALGWTLLLNGLAILLAYGFSIFIGVVSAQYRDRPLDKITTTVLFILYSLPSFWIGTLLLILFTTPDYGLQFFSITGISDLGEGASLGARIWHTARQLVLPVFCLFYGALAVISIQMRGGMLEVLQKDYIRTAYAKGLPRRTVIWKHAFRNALFPIITILGALFPATIAGSVVIEYIFNLPGMGRLMVESIGNKDWPVVYIIMLLSALLTMVGILIADLLYKLADPRVDLNQRGHG